MADTASFIAGVDFRAPMATINREFGHRRKIITHGHVVYVDSAIKAHQATYLQSSVKD